MGFFFVGTTGPMTIPHRSGKRDLPPGLAPDHPRGVRPAQIVQHRGHRLDPGVLGGIWAFIALGPLGGFALVWVGFIAAGCFFAAGGDTKALSKTIVGMIYGGDTH
jgi:Protein of unknown function (DUF1097)